MITYLGYEDLRPKFDAYNVMVSFPVTRDNASGVDVAKIFVKPDTFETNFKDVKFGQVLPFHVTNQYMKFREPQAGTYKPMLVL